MSNYDKPLPQTTPWSQPFWDAAKEHRLLAQHCKECDRTVFYPKLFCPYCYSETLDWREISGEGEIYSFSVVQQHPPSAFQDDLPYVVAIVRLKDGPQMLTNIVNCDPEKIHCGMRVTPAFDDVTDDYTLVKFRPA